MIKKSLLSIALCGAVAAALALDFSPLWKDVEQKEDMYPATALKLTENIASKADSARDEAQLLKALIYRAKLHHAVSDDSVYADLAALEKFAASCRAGDVRAVAHMHIAAAYASLLSYNRRLLPENELQEPDSAESPLFWPAKTYEDTIKSYVRMSIKGASKYKAAKASDYEVLIEEGRDSILTESFYGVMLNKAIDLSESSDSALMRGLYDSLAAAAANPEEKAFAELRRRLYDEADLNAFIAENYDRDIVVYAFYEQAKRLERAEAYSLCKTVEASYPENRYLPFVSSYRSGLEQPYVRAEGTTAAYPGEKCELKLNYRNLSLLKLKIYKINAGREQLLQYPGWIPDSLLTYVTTYNYVLNPGDRVNRRDTTISFALPGDGYYRLAAELPGGSTMQLGRVSSSRLLLLSQNRNEVLYCTAFDRKTGEPQSGVEIDIYYDGKKKASGKTGKNGEAVFRGLRTGRAYRAFLTKGKDCYYPPQMLMVDRRYDVPEYARRISVFTDRKIYRPGQTIYYKAVLCDVGTKVNDRRALEGVEADISISNPYNMEVHRSKAVTSDFGSVAGSFTLPSETVGGGYSITIGGQTAYFRVEEYKRPGFEVKMEPSAEAYGFGDSLISVPFSVSRYSSEPLTGAMAAVRVTRRSLFRGWWFFSGPSVEVMRDTLYIEGGGVHSFAFKPVREGDEIGAVYEAEVSVTAPDGETVSSSKRLRVGDDPVRVSLSAPSFIEKNSRAEISVSAENSEGTALSPALRYALKKDGRELLSGSAAAPARISLELPSDLEPGRYSLHAYALGEEGIEAADSASVMIYDRTARRPPVDTLLWVEPFKDSLRLGEKPLIRLGSSRRAKIMCSVYGRNGMLSREFVSVNNSMARFELKDSYDDESMLRFEAVVVSDGEVLTHARDIRRIKDEKKLNLSFTTFRDELDPDASERWTLHAAYSDGTPAEAEILVSMYDLSLDKFEKNDWGYNTARIIDGIFPYWRLPNLQNGNSMYLRDGMLRSYVFDFNRLRGFGCPLLEGSMFYRPMLLRSASAADVASVAESNKANVDMLMADEAPREEMSSEAAEAAGGVEAQDVRENFAETAFFLPELRTDSAGNAVFTLTTPSDLTKWKIQAAAHTKELYCDVISDTITTRRLLSVRQALPRFAREGDEMLLTATASNISASGDEVRISWTASDRASGKLLSAKDTAFALPAGESRTLSLPVRAERGMEELTLEIRISGGGHSDGERKVLKVLPVQKNGVKTARMQMLRPGEYVLDLSQITGRGSETVQNRACIIELNQNPEWSALMALTYISSARTDNSFDLASAVFSNKTILQLYNENQSFRDFLREVQGRYPMTQFADKGELSPVELELTPWLAPSRDYSDMSYMLDRGRASALLAYYSDKLRELQLPDGSFPWFKGGRPNFAAGIYVADLMSSYNNFSDAYDKLCGYLQDCLADDMRHDFGISRRQLRMMLHCSDETPAYKHYYAKAKAEKASLSIVSKALLARLAYRAGDYDFTNELLASIMEFALYREEAIYWSEVTDLADYVQILRAFDEVDAEGNDVMVRMHMYLLQHKQTNLWKDAATSAMAAQAIISDGMGLFGNKGDAQLPGFLSAKLAEKGSMPGYERYVLRGDELAALGDSIKIIKTGSTPAYISAYMLFTDDLDKFGDLKSKNLQVEKQLYLKKGDGKMTKIKDGAELKAGDELVVRLTIKSDRDYDFVSLRDYRQAALEPKLQESGYVRVGKAYCYREPGDYCHDFYFDELSKGTYVVDYELYVATAGTYRSAPAELQCVFAPEFSSIASSQGFTVKPFGAAK